MAKGQSRATHQLGFMFVNVDDNSMAAAPAGGSVDGWTQRLGRPMWLAMTVLAGAFLLLMAAGAAAQSTIEVVDEIEQQGYYVEPQVDTELQSAIDRAISAGVAFVWLELDGDDTEATAIAESVWLELDSRGSRYGTVLVLVDRGYNAYATDNVSASTLNDGLDAAFDGFSSGAVGRGLDAFTSTLSVGSGAGSTAASEGSSSTEPSSESSGGIGLGTILLGLIILGGGFLLFRSWSGRRQAEKTMQTEMEADRAEIKEQLRDNADRVIDLGDRVLLSEDRELIDIYDEASRTYQEVSHSVDGASTVEEIDSLDDQIDKAEWQFGVIEAKLDGRPVPPSPAEVEAEKDRIEQEEADRKRAENDKPALDRDDSVFDTAGRRSHRSYPRTSYPGGGYPGGRRGGFGGGLGGMLGGIILGQMNRPRSRRSQRRTPSTGGGSLGGGVLRPRGSSRGRSGGGRRMGRPRRGSGRSF